MQILMYRDSRVSDICTGLHLLDKGLPEGQVAPRASSGYFLHIPPLMRMWRLSGEQFSSLTDRHSLSQRDISVLSDTNGFTLSINSWGLSVLFGLIKTCKPLGGD